MSPFKYLIWWLSVVLGFSLFAGLVESSELKLDGSMKQLAVNLFNEFSNKTRLNELLNESSGHQTGESLDKLPDSSLAVIYRNYTLEQIRALENELNQHSHRIYEPIKTKTEEAGHNFLAASKSYDTDGDLKKFEQQFLDTGETLVSLQKLVLRIINSKLVDKISFKNKVYTFRQGRAGSGWFSNMFEQLSKVFFGLPSTMYKTSNVSSVNKLFSLIQQLESNDNSDNREATNQNIANLKRLLDRLRKIQQLNQIASMPNHYLNTEFISPYSYEATLKLVGLLGKAAYYNSDSNTVLGQLRSWTNFFSGGNLFTALMNPFGVGTSSSSNTRPAKYDADKIKKLMKLLEENERIRQSQIERNRQKIALDKLLNNQNKQQQQINSILEILTNNTSANNGNNNNYQNTTPYQPWLVSIGPTTRYPFAGFNPIQPPSTGFPSAGGSANGQWATATTSQKNILKQLKDQRKYLNDLLVDLQKPYTANTTSSSFSQTQYPGASSVNNPSANNRYRPSGQDIAQAQQQMMNIMKNITPIINVMAQTGMVSMPRIQNSKIDLLDIINSVHNSRELDEADPDKEMIRVEKLGEKLESVIDAIIDEAEAKSDAI